MYPIILNYIKEKFIEKTCIIITHNINLLNDNDHILFIDNNRNLCKDTHIQLLKNNVEYKKVLKFN